MRQHRTGAPGGAEADQRRPSLRETRSSDAPGQTRPDEEHGLMKPHAAPYRQRRIPTGTCEPATNMTSAKPTSPRNANVGSPACSSPTLVGPSAAPPAARRRSRVGPMVATAPATDGDARHHDQRQHAETHPRSPDAPSQSPRPNRYRLDRHVDRCDRAAVRPAPSKSRYVSDSMFREWHAARSPGCVCGRPARARRRPIASQPAPSLEHHVEHGADQGHQRQRERVAADPV